MLSQSCLTLWPHGLQPARLLCPWGFSRQEDWSGLPYSPPGDLPNPGIEPRSPSLKADSLPLSHQGRSRFSLVIYFIHSINSVYMPIPISQLGLPLLPPWVSICSFLHLRIDFFLKLVDIIILRRTTLILEFTFVFACVFSTEMTTTSKNIEAPWVLELLPRPVEAGGPWNAFTCWLKVFTVFITSLPITPWSLPWPPWVSPKWITHRLSVWKAWCKELCSFFACYCDNNYYYCNNNIITLALTMWQT